MNRQEDFPIDKTVVREFVDVNKELWVQRKDSLQNRYVVVNFSMVRMQAGWIIPKLLYALGAAETLNAEPIVLTWRENPDLNELFASFGMRHIVLDELNKRNPVAGCRALFKTAEIFLFRGSGEKLQKMQIEGIPVGRMLYEDILRTSSLSTIRSTRNKICIRKMLHLLWMFYGLDAYLKEHKPVFAVADDDAYHEGMQSALFRKNGARVCNSNSVQEKVCHFKKGYVVVRRPEECGKWYHEDIKKLDDGAVKEAERLLQARFQGINGRAIDRDAFAGKQVLDREEACKKLGLDPAKKTVAIMAHTFTDAIYNYGIDYYFRDYYDWLEKTLKIASAVSSVNWILKPHPTRSSYNESEDSIEDMYARNKTPDIHWMDDSVSAETIRNVADVIVTIGGNAGGEFACFGIPAVIVGKPYYRGFGYTYEPASYEEYRETLEHIDRIERLNGEQITTAKKVFYLANAKQVERGAFRDAFADIVNEKYRGMIDKLAKQYFANNDGTESYNTDALRTITEYFKDHDMRQCEYYLRGKMRAEEIVGKRKDI